MKKLTTHTSLIAVLAIFSLTVSFAGWRAQAARGAARNNATAAAIAPVTSAPAAPMFATITVMNTNDSGADSLRQAILDSNASVGVFDTIEFNLGMGTPTIALISALPDITDPVSINGNTGGSTRVELNGGGVGANGLTITAGNSTIAGLVINRFNGYGILIRSNGNTVRNCYIGTDANGAADQGNANTGIFIENAMNNTIGGMSTADRNVISGNKVHGIEIFGSTATGNKVTGNYLGTDVTGAVDLGNSFEGVRLQDAPGNTIGGTNAGERNVISGNNRHGVFIIGATASGNTVIGNYLGTDVNGTADLGNTQDGVNMEGAPNNIVGGITVAERNVISGNNRMGVYIFLVGASGNQVLGNYLGTDVNGTADLGNTFDGILIEHAPNNTVGGTTAAARNVISGNDRYGVRVFSTTATGNAILGNSIFNNSNVGIDLGPDGTVTANDVGDGDTGPNNLQNFPELTCWTNVGGTTTIGGTLNSLATTTFRIEYFLNDACDSSGHGEGQTFLSAQNVTTDASGNAALNVTFASAFAAGKVITATATRLDANSNPVETSEFSKCLVIGAPPTLTISDVTLAEGNAGTTNFVFTVTLSGAQNYCSPVMVNYATADATATAGSDYTATGGTLAFNPPHASNSVTQTIIIPVTGETLVETTETFTVNLSGAINATISDNQGLGTITNDDDPATTPLTAQLADPAICLDPGGLVGVRVTVTNPNNIAQISSWNVTLPGSLTAVAGSCAADVNPGGCVVAANGGSLAWNGTLAANQTVNIIYRARLGANVGAGSQLCLDNQANVGGFPLALQFCFNVVCPSIVNTRVSDQKPGSLLVFPYYTSTLGGVSDTRLTISNISTAASTTANQAYVHLFFIDGTTCQQADLFLCLTPNASFSFKASEYDPGNTGYLLAVAVDRNGVPVQNNVLLGNAFVRTPTIADNYGAESFWANSFSVAAVTGNTATLFFDQVGYDAVPKQFAVEVQSPLDAVGQQVVTAGLSGDLTTSTITGAAQVGTAQAFNEKELFASFQGWLLGTCQARGTIATNSPRVPNGLGNLIKTGQSGYLKFNVGAAVGVLLTPRGGAWTGIRTLHKTQTTTTSLTIPVLPPVC